MLLFSDIGFYNANAENLYYTGDYEISYDINSEGNITVLKCTGSGESVYIPDTIDGFDVSEIAPAAFLSCTNLKTINISDDNKYFRCENNMFMNYGGNILIKYTGDDNIAEIPYGVERIQSNAFFGTESEYIEIPETVSYIDEYAFMGCTLLKSIEIPERVTYIGKGCFFSCLSLENVKLSKNLEKIFSDTFYACPNLEKLVIPESVNEIQNDIFSPSESASYNPVILGFYGGPARNYAYQNNIEYRMMGDINGDSALDSSDASRVLSDYAKTSSGVESGFDEIQKISADMNCDGKVDASDASKILAKYAEISLGT